MAALKIIAFALLAAGLGIVFGAGKIVEHFQLDKNTKCDFSFEMREEELNLYKYNKAVINTKMLGMLIALPGFILVFIVFR
ncbi:MAG TPA: hypothetical protein GXX49_06145 [Clostridiaceae bacterium]|jgi:hypothetical protein|nr:hypothetical protein [Clostridiaceae bacterium]